MWKEINKKKKLHIAGTDNHVIIDYKKEGSMKKVVLIFVVAFFAIAAMQLNAFADRCPMDKCKMMSKNESKWCKMDLDKMFMMKAQFILANATDIALNDDQIEKINNLKYMAKKKLIQQDADIKSYFLDAMQELAKPDIDVAVLNSIVDKKYAVKIQKAKDLVSEYAELKKILTKDQAKKLKEIWTKGMTCDTKDDKMGSMGEKPMMGKMDTDDDSGY